MLFQKFIEYLNIEEGASLEIDFSLENDSSLDIGMNSGRDHTKMY